MIEVASKLGPALQMGSVWQESQAPQSQPQPQPQVKAAVPAVVPAGRQPSAPPQPDPTPPPAYPSSSGANPTAIAGASPAASYGEPPPYDDCLAQAPEPPTHEPRDAPKEVKPKSLKPLPAM